MNTKLCRRCREILPLDRFYNNKRQKDGKDFWCISCRRAHSKAYRDRHPERVEKWRHTQAQKVAPEDRRKYHVARVNATRAWLNNLKESMPCMDCGGVFPAVCMDFDHVSGEKRMSIAKMVSDGYTQDAILEEISKCELVCANCHRIRTHNGDRGYTWSERLRVYDRATWEATSA